MPTTEYGFFSDDQIERALGQFQRALSGFHVQSGPAEGDNVPTKRVSVVFGDMEKIVARIISRREETRQKATIPMIATNLKSISVDTDRKVSRSHIDEIVTRSKKDTGYEVMERVFGPALIMNVDANLMCSSRSELYQLFEQLMLVFNPRVTINVDDTLDNPMYITDIFLTDISQEFNYPMGSGARSNIMTISFQIPIRLRYPNKMSNEIVEVIKAKILRNDLDGEVIEEFTVDGDDVE